jgi:hypothetical protein
MINSIIASGKSFVGSININGNLNGDILLPKDLLATLLASNAPTATVDTSQLENSEMLANFTTNQAITNDVNVAAQSGNAGVNKNTTGGNATSGNSETNLTVLNLTGRQVIGSNALLVFVNVYGKWIGMIMDAPGSTAAAIGGGITENGYCNCYNRSNVNSTENFAINNDINVSAQSGEALVERNTTGGNATSGNAKAGVNLTNMMNSNFSLSNWFGVLFINVFGTWEGSFGVNTYAGTTTGGRGAGPAAADNVKVFQFVPTAATTSKPKYRVASANPIYTSVEGASTTAQALDRELNPANATDTATAAAAVNKQGHGVDWVIVGFGAFAGASLLGIERFLAFRERRKL